MTVASRTETRIEVSSAFQDRWRGFRAALSAASVPFTGNAALFLPPDIAHDIKGADLEMKRALDKTGSGDVEGWFRQDAQGHLFIAVSPVGKAP